MKSSNQRGPRTNHEGSLARSVGRNSARRGSERGTLLGGGKAREPSTQGQGEADA